MKTVLIDMDNVLFHFDGEFMRMLKEKHPEIEPIPYEQSIEYDLEKLYPESQREAIRSIWDEEGFFRNLPLMPGALEALAEISRKNKVFICSSPADTPYCKSEKFASIEEKLGTRWRARTLFRKDKTGVPADILIDDKPKIIGASIPKWEHVIFDHMYNRHIKDKRRITWQNYREILPELF